MADDTPPPGFVMASQDDLDFSDLIPDTQSGQGGDSIDFADLIPAASPRAPTGAAPVPEAAGMLDALRRAAVGALGIPAAEAAVRGGGSPAPPAPAPAQPPPQPPQAAPQPPPAPPQPTPGAPQPQAPQPPVTGRTWAAPIEDDEDLDFDTDEDFDADQDDRVAEPLEDIVAQAQDLADSQNRRQALFLAKASREALRANEAAANQLVDEMGRRGIDLQQHSIDDFDGRGGLLIVPDARLREQAEQRLDRGESVEAIIGTMIGAGRGKPSPVLPDGAPAPLRTVQQMTPAGAVTLERMVATDEDEHAALRDLALAGRSVQVVSPQEALERRTQRLAASQPAGVQPGSGFSQPVDDLLRQAREIATPGSQQRGLWLPGSTLDALADDGAAAERLAAEFERLGIGSEVTLDNVDGQGGVLVVPDASHRKRARGMIGGGVPPQRIIEALTRSRAGQPSAGASSPEAAGAGSLYAIGAERFTPAFRARQPEAVAAVERELRRMLPQDVALRLLPYVQASGGVIDARIAAKYSDRHMQQIVSVALADGLRVAKVKGFHEVAAHALRGGNFLYRSLYTAEEWKILLAKAKEVGAEFTLQSPIPGVPAIKAYQQISTQYGQEAGYRGAELRRYVVEALDQERVGALAEMWAEGSDFGAKVNSLLERIIRFLEAIGNALNGLGFQSYEDVFQRVVAGEVAQRGDKKAAEPAAQEQSAESVAAIRRRLDVADADEAVRVGREQAAALKRLMDERRRAETQQTRARDAGELPDVDRMDTFDLRHLAKDLGLADNLWRGRRAADIRAALKKRGSTQYADRGPTPAPPPQATPAGRAQAERARDSGESIQATGKGGRFKRAAPTVIKELGEHPTEGGKLQVLSGRHGPYVKHGDVKVTLPRGKAPEALTVEEAVQLIARRGRAWRDLAQA